MRLLITVGDPAGVGPEVLLKALQHLRVPSSVSISIVGDLRTKKFRPGRVSAQAGRAAYLYLKEAVELLKRGKADALVTAPVSKEAIVRAGIPWVGHTEFLGKSFRAQTVMMFVTGSFRVSLVTTHLALKEIPGRLHASQVTRVLKMTRDTLKRDFDIRSPRIGLAALNPHGGEGGLFGKEEKKILRPAAQAAGRWVRGPVPVDSLMQAASKGAFDAVVAIYHDQALIPVKLLGWEKAVHVTLGLPFVRTSPVHGTAFDIAGRGTADHRSMQAAIEMAIRLARRRASGQ